MTKSLNITCDAISSVEMVILALLSIGAIYALIPVLIILILIAAAAGLRGGGDLFALLGFGAIMQMASGFGAGGAGKGISKTTEFKELMSTPGGGVKARMAGYGARSKNKASAKKMNKQNVYLRSSEGQGARTAAKAVVTRQIVNDYVKKNGLSSPKALNSDQRREIKGIFASMDANPRQWLVAGHRNGLDTGSGFRRFMTTLSETDSKNIGKNSTDSKGIGKVRLAIRAKFGWGGFVLEPTIRWGTKTAFSKKGLAGYKFSTPMANIVNNSRNMKAEKLANREIGQLMKSTERTNPGYVDGLMRAQVRAEYAGRGPGVAAVAEWRYGAGQVPIVGGYGAAAATVLIAAMSMPVSAYHFRTPASTTPVVPGGPPPVPVPSYNYFKYYGSQVFSRQLLTPIPKGDWSSFADKTRFVGTTIANFFDENYREHYTNPKPPQGWRGKPKI